MFKDTPQGTTHYHDDGCGEPEHNDMTTQEKLREDLHKLIFTHTGAMSLEISMNNGKITDTAMGFRDKLIEESDFILSRAIPLEAIRELEGKIIGEMRDLRYTENHDYESKPRIAEKNESYNEALTFTLKLVRKLLDNNTKV